MHIVSSLYEYDHEGVWWWRAVVKGAGSAMSRSKACEASEGRFARPVVSGMQVPRHAGGPSKVMFSCTSDRQ